MQPVTPSTALEQCLEQDFVRTLTKICALPVNRQGPIGLAVSGGSDSIALMQLAAATRDQHGRRLIVLTVDHGLRPEAVAEAQGVARMAEVLGLSQQTLRWHAPIAKAASARAARYYLLSQALTASGGTLLLTGHTQDDQAETCLLREAAGSGPYGLAGMQTIAVTPGFASGDMAVIGRPLLRQRRESLRHYATRSGLTWIDDPSNRDTRFARTKARAILASDAALASRLLSAAFTYGIQRRAADLALSDWLNTAVSSHPNGFAFVALPETDELGARTLGWLIQLLTGRASPPRTKALKALASRLTGLASFRGATLGGARLRVSDGTIQMEAEHGHATSDLNARVARLSEVLKANAVTVW